MYEICSLSKIPQAALDGPLSVESTPTKRVDTDWCRMSRINNIDVETVASLALALFYNLELEVALQVAPGMET